MISAKLKIATCPRGEVPYTAPSFSKFARTLLILLWTDTAAEFDPKTSNNCVVEGKDSPISNSSQLAKFVFSNVFSYFERKLNISKEYKTINQSCRVSALY